MNLKKKKKEPMSKVYLKASIKQINEKLQNLGDSVNELYLQLNILQALFDMIGNVPIEKIIEYKKIKELSSNYKYEAEMIQKNYNDFCHKNAKLGVAGAGVGVTISALGPSTAMGIATSFGVASTGTAISSLSGVAATNAALAWLGGGALIAEGGGMALGGLLLGSISPIGIAIVLASGVFGWKNTKDNNRINEIFEEIDYRDLETYKLANVELYERINSVVNETLIIKDAINTIKSFGIDYSTMTEVQKYTLGSYVNLMNASVQLLVSPIINLLPKYTEEDFMEYVLWKETIKHETADRENKNVYISLANLLYKIQLDEHDKKLVVKTLKSNKEFLESIHLNKKEFSVEIINEVENTLQYKYKN